ncbi:PREDICTED: uncharacterized protein LOC105449812 [Wasmannia auropunctata]|uniref:uncharacterized protein LOC105449812 n=1 Tax=Wasmannia auropunctata TaxID=64793 RepID=UPI0005F0837D|nr:PREDICTED: uncharacterized protein LOC105449812 [Wasmannia auropunctata]
MEELYSEQEDVIRSITRTVTNFKKLGQGNYTTSITRNCLNILQELWTRCQSLHAEIKLAATDDEREGHDYFTKEGFLKAEAEYYDASDFFTEIFDKLSKPVIFPPIAAPADLSNSGVSECSATPRIPLPRIELPKFSGLLTEWVNFRDIFESLVANNEVLSNVQRLHYLKSSLTGAAQLILKNTTVTDANYEIAWNALKNRYENKRVIVSAHINNILDAPNMKADTTSEFKRVYDTVTDSLAALRCLERSTIDDFIVIIAARKLDPHTRTEWELSQGNTTEPPSFTKLTDFLLSRIVALEAANGNSDNPSNKSHRASSTKSLASMVNNTKCPMCNESHPLYQYANFKLLSLDKRMAVARQHRCCFNCLSKGHIPSKCPSRNRCKRCQRKHNTLFHDDNYNLHSITFGNKTEDTGVKTAAYTAERSVSETIPKSSVTLKLSVTKESNHVPSSSVMLATARILVCTESGRQLKLRALIDTGSEATFITERAAQLLRAKRKKVHIQVTGLGGRTNSTVHFSTKLIMKPCSSETESVSVTALILPNLTSYNPGTSLCKDEILGLRNLQLADSHPSSRERIDVLIGADIYGLILLNGLLKIPDTALVAQHTIFGWVLFGSFVKNTNNDTNITANLQCSIKLSIDVILKKFWEIEEVSHSPPLSKED